MKKTLIIWSYIINWIKKCTIKIQLFVWREHSKLEIFLHFGVTEYPITQVSGNAGRCGMDYF